MQVLIAGILMKQGCGSLVWVRFHGFRGWRTPLRGVEIGGGPSGRRKRHVDSVGKSRNNLLKSCVLWSSLRRSSVSGTVQGHCLDCETCGLFCMWRGRSSTSVCSTPDPFALSLISATPSGLQASARSVTGRQSLPAGCRLGITHPSCVEGCAPRLVVGLVSCLVVTLSSVDIDGIKMDGSRWMDQDGWIRMDGWLD